LVSAAATATFRAVLPVLVDLPQLGVAIHSRGLMIVLAAVLCNTLGARWIESLEGIDRRQSRRALLWLLPPVFIGGRLHYVLNHWATHVEQPLSVLISWGRGMHAGGAIVAMAVAMPFILRRLSIPIGKFADGAAPAIALAIGVARLGCFLRGCCYGTICAWPWGVSFPDTALAYTETSGLTAGAPLHPVQLYFALAAVLVALCALAMRRLRSARRYDGQIALVALLLHSLSAAAIEPFRADHPGRVYWGALPQLEWMALATIAATSLALVAVPRLAARRRRRETAALARSPGTGV
jgi:phosphatidylglycerol---prolipoprotein diacylglyceryl transferase